MLLFPPLHTADGENEGYGFLFVPSYYRETVDPNDPLHLRGGPIPAPTHYYDTVNIAVLVTQWAGVLIIGGILLLALRDKE
jgi:hypothetical protein